MSNKHLSGEEFSDGSSKGYRLIRNGLGIATPEPPPDIPVHRCHGATDSVILTLVDLEYPYTYQAIEINGELFNAEHEENVFGGNEEEGGRPAVYTTSTGYSVTFEVVLPFDANNPKIRLKIKKHANSTDYVNIRLLPDPSATAEDIYNNIASVEGGGTIVFTGINDIIEFCLKPEYKDPSKYDCDGAHDNIGFLRYNPQLVEEPNRYYAVVPTKYNVTIDNIDYGVIDFTERDPDADGVIAYKFKSQVTIGEWILSINPQYWGRCYLSLTNGIQAQPIHIKLDPVESELSGDLHIKFDNFWLDINDLDETVTYNPDTGVIEFCLVDNYTPVQCRGATNELGLTLTQVEANVDDWGFNYVCNYSVELNGELFNADFQEDIFNADTLTEVGGLRLALGHNEYSEEPLDSIDIYAELWVSNNNNGAGLITPVHVKLTPPPNVTKNLITSGNIENNSSIKIDPQTGVVTFCLYGEIPS